MADRSRKSCSVAVPAIVYSAAYEIEAMAVDGADVINMSFGGKCNWWCRTFAGTMESGKDPHDALRSATSQGVIPVAAAGNGDDSGHALDVGYEDFWGHRTILPCEAPGVICVGAVGVGCDALGANCFMHAGYSNYGNNVDIWAPTDIAVMAPANTDNNYPPLGFFRQNVGGTSMSAPYVSGIMALIKALYDPDDRATFDSAAANSLLDETASFMTSDSDRVNGHGGLIQPWAMVETQAQEAFGLEEADIDDNEPNDTRADATHIGLNATAAGIIMPRSDEDWYRLDVDDYYQVTARISTEQARNTWCFTSTKAIATLRRARHLPPA